MPTAEVVTYDPVRRQGFMKILDRPGGRVVFHLGYLPEPIMSMLLVPSKLLRAELQHEAEDRRDFPLLMRQIKSMIVGCRFTMEVKARPNGRPTIIRNSLKLLARPAPTPPPGLAQSEEQPAVTPAASKEPCQ